MKVLMQCRKNIFSLRGGDTVQLEKTKEELEKLGVEVDVCLDENPDLSQYDLVHLFNMTRIQETYLHTKNAVKQNKPIALSTIFWPMDEFEKQGQVGIRKIINKSLDINTEEKIKAMARYCLDKESRNQITKNLWQVGYSNMQKYVVEHVDYFLPNAQLEMEEMFRYFDFSTKDYTVVPNAIDANIALETLKQSDDKRFEKYRGAVICVGRIEPRKNQLALVKAMFSSDYKLILVGEVSRNQRSYYNKIKKFIDKSDKITHIRKMDNKDLYKLYKVCKVSTLPSWLDTPGLVSLEAAVMGCNLAVSEKGTTTEYFEDYAEYCVPDDLRSIRRAVEKAYRKPYDEGLKEKILTSYTWAEAARKTLEGYNKTLEKRK